MTLNELKTKAATLGITADDARQCGHIGHKATWQAAIDKMSEAVALADDAMTEVSIAAESAVQEARYPAQDAAQVVTEAVYSELSAKVFYSVVYVVGWTAIALILLTAKLIQTTWQASAPLRHRASGRIHSELWAFVGPWPDLLFGL